MEQQRMDDYIFESECNLIISIIGIDQPLAPPSNIKSLNWSFIIRTLTDNRLAGLAYWHISSSHSPAWPKEFLKKLEEQFFLNQFINVMLLQEAGRIFSVLKENDIEAVALKGITLIEEFYPVGARKLGDIDIFIPPEQAEVTISTLEGIGYECRIPLDLSKGYAELYLARGNLKVPVDLSWKFLHRTKFENTKILSFDEVSKRCPKINISNVEVKVLDRIDQIIHTASHVALHHELNFLPGLTDVCMFLSRDKDLDWKELEDRALKAGLSRTVTTVIGVINDLFGVPIPEDFFIRWKKLRHSLLKGPECIFLDRFWILGAEIDAEVKAVKGGLKRNIARFFWNQVLPDSYSNRFSVIVDYLWPSEERIKKTYRARNRLIILFYQILHIPLILSFSIVALPLFLVLRPTYALYLRHKIGTRMVGIT